MRERPGVAVFVGLFAFGCALFGLGLGVMRLGPSEWDDALYCHHAAAGTGQWYIRNRYVHIWLLRLSFQLFGSRPLGASVLPLCMVLGLACVSFFYARRLAGPAAGALALLSIPLYTPLLKYLTVPHVDITMAFFSLSTVAAAFFASEAKAPLPRRAWLVISGVSAFFAIESKETGLAAPPVALYVLWSRAQLRREALSLWSLGAVLGLGIHAALDAAFVAPGTFFPSNPLQYFGRVPAQYARAAVGASAPGVHKLSHSFVEHLTEPSYLAITLLGLAGAAHGFSRSLGVRALTLWWLGMIALTSLVSWISPNIQAYDRYLVAPGVALILLAVYRVCELWSRPQSDRFDQALWIVPSAAFLLWVSGRALYALALDRATSRDQAALLFVLPLLMLLLFLTPFLSTSRLLARGALSCLLALSFGVGAIEAGQHVKRTREALAPWVTLASVADQTEANVAAWKTQKHPISRLRWRLRTLSTRPFPAMSVRKIGAPSEAEPNEIIFTEAKDLRALRDAGFELVARGEDRKGKAWSAHVRMKNGRYVPASIAP